MLFSVLTHYLDLYITDTALKVSQSLYFSLLLYLMVLKTISPGCGVRVSLMLFLCDIMASLCGIRVCVRVNNFFSKTTSPRDMLFFMSSLCGVGVRVRVRVRLNNFSSKTTRPRDMLFFLKDTLSIEDEKLFKACKSVCSSVC